MRRKALLQGIDWLHEGIVAWRRFPLPEVVSTRERLVHGAFRGLHGFSRPLKAARNKKLLGAPGIATRSEDATRGSWPYY